MDKKTSCFLIHNCGFLNWIPNNLLIHEANFWDNVNEKRNEGLCMSR